MPPRNHVPFQPDANKPNAWAIGHTSTKETYQPYWRGVTWADLRLLIETVPWSDAFAVTAVGLLYPVGNQVKYDTIAIPTRDWLMYTGSPGARRHMPYGWRTMTFEEQVELVFRMRFGTPQHVVGWVINPTRLV